MKDKREECNIVHQHSKVTMSKNIIHENILLLLTITEETVY